MLANPPLQKPHLGEEQQRVEKMGGSVYLPPGFLATGKGTTRVMYRDPLSGGEFDCGWLVLLGCFL